MREHSGYPIGPSGRSGGSQAASVEIMVIDRDYGHRVVHSSFARLGRLPAATKDARARDAARALAAELNLAHEMGCTA